jgi:hypothetical protein
MSEKSPWSEALEKAQKVAEELKAEVLESAKKWQASDAVAKAKAKAEELRTQVVAAAEKTTAKAEEMSQVGKRIVAALNTAAVDAKDRDRFVASAVDLMKDIASQTDAKAAAVGVGYVAEAGAGVAGTTGIEVRYVKRAKGAGMLLVSRIEGRSLRLAIGATTNAYVISAYGEPLILRGATQRRGADVEVIVASIGFFSMTSALTSEKEKASGWMAGLGAGLSIGIPILSDLTAFELEEAILEKIVLTDGESDAFDAALAEAPDRAMRRKIAEAL